MKILIKPLPTHIAKTNNKKAPNKYMKINNQSIYNGTLNYFSRNIVVANLRNVIMKSISKNAKIDYPIRVKILIKTVYNHDNIRRMKKDGRIIWNPPKPNYKPSWDCDNLSVLWIKTIQDAIVKFGLIPDDTVEYIRGGSYDIEFVNSIKDIEMIITLEKV